MKFGSTVTFQTAWKLPVWEDNSNLKDQCKNKQKRTNYTIKKSSKQMPIILTIQESDHVGQQNVIGFLASKEHTQPCYPIFH